MRIKWADKFVFRFMVWSFIRTALLYACGAETKRISLFVRGKFSNSPVGI